MRTLLTPVLHMLKLSSKSSISKDLILIFLKNISFNVGLMLILVKGDLLNLFFTFYSRVYPRNNHLKEFVARAITTIAYARTLIFTVISNTLGIGLFSLII